MKEYTNQYNLLFSLTWAPMFLVYPSWALPIPLLGRKLLFFALIVYFFAAAYIMQRSFAGLSINKSIIICPKNFLGHIKDNAGLVVICSLAVLLHIKLISSPIYLVGDETLFLQSGLWIYDYFGAFWHHAVKYIFWISIVFAIITAGKRYSGSSANDLSRQKKAGRSQHVFFIVLGICLLSVYFILNRDLSFSSLIVRYPPLQKFLYLFGYFIFGINHTGPRLIQLAFYILSAVYIYKIIILYYEKDTALLGAAVYLFSPIIFSHAHFAELASGVVFFIIIISYYFLIFLMYHDNRGLLLSSYFIGTGFLYKRDIFLMFFICCTYLVFHSLRNRDLPFLKPLKILCLPLFPIIPWMVICKFFNWRTSGVDFSQFASFEKVVAYFIMIPTIISWSVFILFLLSALFILVYKRDTLLMYWGFLFIAFYAFYTSQSYGQNYPRFSMAFYPTIAIFLASFLTAVTQKINWKYSLKAVSALLSIYLIILCAVPSVSSKLISYENEKAQYFPNEQAIQWVRESVGSGEKILYLRFKTDLFYRDKYGMDENNIISFWYHLNEVDTPQKLKAFCRTNEVTYIVFPDSPKFNRGKGIIIFDYLKSNIDGDYVQVAKFNMEDNYVFIYKFRES